MNILKKWGFVKDDQPTEPVKKVDSPQNKPPVSMSFGPSTGYTPVQTTNGPDYSKQLAEVLEEHNQPGFDFLEFHKTLNGLEGKPLAEPQKYQTAFTAAQSMNVKVQDLLESGQHYLKVLDAEEQDFAKAMAVATEEKITSKTKEIERLGIENQELARKIEENNKKQQALNMEVMESSNDLNTKKTTFDYAITNLRGLITDRLSKIPQFCDGTS